MQIDATTTSTARDAAAGQREDARIAASDRAARNSDVRRDQRVEEAREADKPAPRSKERLVDVRA